MPEQTISSTVINTKIVKPLGIFGHINKKFNDIGASIGGLFVAPIIFLLAFGLLIYSENIARNSNIITKLPLESAADAVGKSGLKELEGKLIVTAPVTAPQIGKVAYYSYITEEYKSVEKQVTKKVNDVVDGKQVEKTIAETKLVDEWVKKGSDSAWGKISVGPIEVNPKRAKIEINFSKKKYIENRSLFDHTYKEISTDNVSPQIGDKRLTVTYLPLEQNMIVVGDLSQDSIRSGEVFILTNKSAAELITDLKSAENTTYLLLKVGVFFLFFISIMKVVRPILEIVDMIPIAGKAASTAASAIGAVIAFLLVLIGSIVVKFWFIFLLLCVLFLGLAIFILFEYITREKHKESVTKTKKVVTKTKAKAKK